MATSNENYDEYTEKRYNAKYKCKKCQETWKSKNTSHLKMICKNPNCRNLVRSYKFEAISKLVVYQCHSCKNKIKKTRCSSEVKDVPYCTICQQDMSVFLLKDLWKKKRKFGYYRCDECTNEWQSGYAWEGVGQQCRLCKILVLPYRLDPLRFNPARSKGQPHRQDLCDMCKLLGHNCKDYTPTDDNVALMNEIPLEEDTQSVITTNSSIIGDEVSTTAGIDGDDNGGDRTPVNLSDVELDDIDDSDQMNLEEHFTKLQLGHS